MSASPSYDPAAQFARLSELATANIEMMREANAVMAEGLRDITQEMASLAQISMDSAAAAGKAALAARSLQAVVAVHTDYTRASLERLKAHATRLGEMSLKLLTDSFGPLRSRATAAIMKKAG